MKRNETILVYSVTGLLVVILGVAIAFGDGGVQAGTSLDLKTLEQLQGVVGAKPGDEKPAENSPEAGANGAAPSGELGTAGPAGAGGEGLAGVTPAPTVPLNAPLSIPAVPVVTDAATRAIVLLGESSRDGDYRVVAVRHGDTFSQLVQRWCGGVDQMDLAASLNEEFDLGRLEPGTRLYLPWIDNEVLLAAHERRTSTDVGPAGSRPRDALAVPAVQRAPGASEVGVSVEEYKVQPGDMLWTLAVSRVGANKANKFIDAVRDLNPDLRADPNRLSAGKTIRLPR